MENIWIRRKFKRLCLFNVGMLKRRKHSQRHEFATTKRDYISKVWNKSGNVHRNYRDIYCEYVLVCVIVAELLKQLIIHCINEPKYFLALVVCSRRPSTLYSNTWLNIYNICLRWISMYVSLLIGFKFHRCVHSKVFLLYYSAM